MRVSVIGGGDPSTTHGETARAVGQLLADGNHTLVCGGRGA